MQELMWYALSHGITRPVPVQDVPLWFAALLVFGLLCAGLLIALGIIEGCRNPHRRSVRPGRLALAATGKGMR